MLLKGLLKEYSRLLSMLLRFFDISAVLTAGIVAYVIKFQTLDIETNYIYGLGAAAFLTPFIFRFFQVYDPVRAKSYLQHFQNLLQAVLALFFVIAGLVFISKTSDSFSRVWFLLWILLSIALLLIERGSMILTLRFMRKHGWNERRVIILGTSELSFKIASKIQSALWTGFRITAIFDDNYEQSDNPLIQKTPDNLEEFIRSNSIDEVWIAYPLAYETRVKEILHELRHQTVATRLLLDIFGLNLFNQSIGEIAGFPVLNIRSTPMVGVNRFIKAMEDRILSAVILLLISPVLIIISVAVKLNSKGPVFYKQKRVSWNGREFEMLKFRTMPVDAESKTGPVWATKDERRATKIGAFLRKTSLDELPQFFNVLKGDMAIVGPRPERLVFVDEFKEKIPGYMQKHLVKAGITGWAQVNGWRGNTSLEKRIEYDLYYIENWSLHLDLKIIFLTLFQGFVNKNAY